MMLYSKRKTNSKRRGATIIFSAALAVTAIVFQSQTNLMAQDKTKKNKAANSDAKKITRENIKETGGVDLYYQEKQGDKIVVVEPQEQNQKNVIFTTVEQMPEFPGGQDSLVNYLATNIRYPETARKDKIEGRVVGQFVVNETGNVVDVKIVRGLNADFDAETIRVLNNMPDWSPGRQGGKNVSVYYTLPITFKLN